MKKLTPILAVLLVVGLTLFFFTRETHIEPVEIKTIGLCENAAPSCHADGVRKYKTMTPLSTFGAVLAGVSAVGLVAVVGNQTVKKQKRKK
jgi:hypothetical protein